MFDLKDCIEIAKIAHQLVDETGASYKIAIEYAKGIYKNKDCKETDQSKPYNLINEFE